MIATVWMMAQAGWAGPVPSEPDPPSELLDFLGTWQTSDGKDIDPFDLADGTDSSSSYKKPQQSPGDSGSKELPKKRAGHRSPPQKDSPQERRNP